VEEVGCSKDEEGNWRWGDRVDEARREPARRRGRSKDPAKYDQLSDGTPVLAMRVRERPCRCWIRDVCRNRSGGEDVLSWDSIPLRRRGRMGVERGTILSDRLDGAVPQEVKKDDQGHGNIP